MSLLLSIAVLLTLSGGRQVDGPAAADGIFNAYFRIAATLAADQVAGVKTEAAQIAKAAGGIGNLAKIAAAARELEATQDLAHARVAFSDLSDALIAFARATHRDLAGSGIAYCTMAGKYWIQQGSIIKNPYYGARMVACVELVK